ncbi:unnamed protein product [Diatraea saccharalis]|uniref:DUF659 domain-containing protein n=1 Tax=Diatraea saccharalis TaxID=40085 RepID=A0A9N9R9S9_9NEOP|nr:unnamed protein product [Diatraea saccharalis]
MIASKYLEKIYKEMYKDISNDLKASKFLHLQCDGWTDTCNEVLDDENKANIKTSVENRAKQCLKPIHYAAYMLDPKSIGVELNQVEDTEAMEFSQKVFIHSLAQYRDCELEYIEPVASTSSQTNDIEFINIEHVYDTDSD